jgi:hypothetical protein
MIKVKSLRYFWRHVELFVSLWRRKGFLGGVRIAQVLRMNTLNISLTENCP